MKKILIIDADQDNLQLVKFILTSRGFDVFTHSTGLGVLDVVRKYVPNLNLSAIQSSGKSDIKISKEFKRMYSASTILISGYSNKSQFKKKILKAS